jgi:hypothetical protein
MSPTTNIASDRLGFTEVIADNSQRPFSEIKYQSPRDDMDGTSTPTALGLGDLYVT